MSFDNILAIVILYLIFVKNSVDILAIVILYPIFGHICAAFHS